MRSFAALCSVALPIAASFTLRPSASSRHTTPRSRPDHVLKQQHCQNVKTRCGIMRSCRMHSSIYSGGPPRVVRWYHAGSHSTHRGRGLMRRSAKEGGGESDNLDPSDDPDDSEIYASLRKRLEELEKRAGDSSSTGGDSRMAETPRATNFKTPKYNDDDKANGKAMDKRSPEERTKALAWLTIQSVGVISVALSLGTAALYWLAGEYFVHLGPREFPGSSASRRSAVERKVDGEGAGSGTAPEKPRRTIGESTTREAFSFEGFPDAARGAVKPDF